MLICCLKPGYLILMHGMKAPVCVSFKKLTGDQITDLEGMAPPVCVSFPQYDLSECTGNTPYRAGNL